MGLAVSDKLDVVENKRLRKLVKIVDDGMESVRKVGDALLEIQETKLWRGKHKSFHAFCKERWGYKKAYAYELTGNAQVRDNLSTIVDSPLPENESQTSELSGLEPEEQKAVWGDVLDDAKETGEPITAATVKAKVEHHAAIDEPYEEPTEAPEPPEIDRKAIVKKGRKALGELVRALDDLGIEWKAYRLDILKAELK